MKKILVAFALVAFANSAFALIAGTKHDFVTNGYVSPAPISTCKFCHTPHNAISSVAPLWIRTLKSPTSYYISTAVGTNTSVDARGTQTCLACHATGAAADMGTTSSMAAGSNAIVGTDLGNDHPVGNATIITLGTANGFQNAITLGGKTIATGTQLDCTGCHDVHNSPATQTGTKLLKSYTGNDFCVACHYK